MRWIQLICTAGVHPEKPSNTLTLPPLTLGSGSTSSGSSTGSSSIAVSTGGTTTAIGQIIASGFGSVSDATSSAVSDAITQVQYSLLTGIRLPAVVVFKASGSQVTMGVWPSWFVAV